MGENVNNLSLYDVKRVWKVPKLKEVNRRYQTDGYLLQDCDGNGTDFWQLSEDQAFDVLFGETDCRYVTANNTTEASAWTQYGGVATINFPRLAGFILEMGKDPTGLARWCYTYVGTASRKTQIVTAYRPVKPPHSQRKGKHRGWYTRWAQHRRWIRKNGFGRISPWAKFYQDLLQQLLTWKAAGDEIILFMDVNDHVYNGLFSQRLGQEDLMMHRIADTTGCFCT